MLTGRLPARSALCPWLARACDARSHSPDHLVAVGVPGPPGTEHRTAHARLLLPVPTVVDPPEDHEQDTDHEHADTDHQWRADAEPGDAGVGVLRVRHVDDRFDQ